ncbi:hypothetical protein ACSHWG_06260 [Leucobacter sp. Z1108]|uniref:hypothetical protein n=1 Tax=Leucobacter sp. Z1108 TaxID=3439066 RepID=UPI003F327C34
MSDNEEDRPLSRRERRLKELGETGMNPVVSGATAPGADPRTDLVDFEEIVISPVDEHGRPRTRREMRELREQALAERAAQAEEVAALEPSVNADVDAPAEESEPGVTDAPVIQADEAPEVVADTEATTDTEAVEIEKLFEAEETVAVQDDAAGDPQPDSSVPAFDDHLAQTQPFSPADFAAATTAAEVDEVVEIHSDEDGDADEDGDEMLDAEIAADTVPISAIRERSTRAAEAPQAYTFPDIAPLDDGISVFDNPASRGVSGKDPGSVGENGGGFDDIISRAVAQEGAASASSSSALILPAMPESGQLAGRLGETGELYITGSIELPRSLGETGGHASLLDSVEADPLDELGFADRAASSGGIAPVSAARAVSARATLGPVVTEAQKEKSKLPVVLIATGGGLVVAVVALLVWGATSGMFG